ncbi:hypothetical protein SO802_011481 [Lithocarpus litseifolius]|uniref:Uncharacterized protein n=1 Tax=Lithocarpus litseifolius TaxID=425828 RepID=A0AAW2D3I7_9ROSI
MDVNVPLGFGAPGDLNPPPSSPGSANPNPPKPATPIGLGAPLRPLSPKQGGMLQHMKVCKKWPFPRDDKQKPLSFQEKREGKSGSNVLVVANYSEERIRLALTRMIIIDELPFKFVERQGFQEFMEIVEPRFPIPHHTTIARACMKIYSSEVDILRGAFVGQRVCVITDTWTSIQNLNYMWGIGRLFTITVDNASSNDVATDYVKKKTKERDSSILGGEFMHMRCYAHILNLIVQSGLKSIHESIAKVRNVVRYMRASPARFEKFQECVENEKIKAKCLLSLDVPTRWNSTYLMLDCSLKFVRAFDRLVEGCKEKKTNKVSGVHG